MVPLSRYKTILHCGHEYYRAQGHISFEVLQAQKLILATPCWLLKAY